MLHEERLDMFARIALAALVLTVSSCNKSQAPIQIHEPVAPVVSVVEGPVVVPEKPEVKVGNIDPAEFAHVVHQDHATYVVLSAEPDHEHWAKGTASLMSRESPVVARRDVDTSLLPKTMSRLVGRSMRLVGKSGEVCRGTVGAPFLMSRVEPHFGERSQWNGEIEDDNGNKAPPLSDDRVAEIAWDMAYDGKLLVAELDDATGDCQDARFARAADLPAITTTAGRRPDASLTVQAMNAFRQMQGYEAIDDLYRVSSQATPSTSWTESQNAYVDLVEFSTGKGTYVWISATGGEACSDFSGSMSVLWKVSGTNAKHYEFEMMYEGEGEFSPEMFMQLPGDAGPSLLGRESMLRKDQKVYEVHELHVPFLDCPC